jgi:ribosomal protein S18 acetylase RimI-like enzyme
MQREVLYHQVAALHANNIDQGFLTILGEPFLALVYQAIDEAPDGVLIVEEREGQALGFVAGGTGMRTIYRQLLCRPLALAIALGPSLLRPARLRRILEILRYGAHATAGLGGSPLPAAELFSFAVAPSARGQGVADSLYRGLVGHFSSKGLPEFRIVVGASLYAAHRFYRRMGALPVRTIEVHAGEKSIV